MRSPLDSPILASTATEALNMATDVLPPLLMVVGVVMLGIILTMSIRGKIARRRDDRTPRERIDEIRARAAELQKGDDLRASEVRLLETAERLASQLDAKAERLEQLIVQAEQRIATLRGLDPDPGRTDRAGRDVASVRPDDPPVPAAEPAMPRDPLTASVYRLADAGHDSIRIAQALDEQVGKVELILALRESARPVGPART